MIAEFKVYASLWDRLRFWLHGRLYRTVDVTPIDVTPNCDGEGALLIACSCGGQASIYRCDDGEAWVVVASCPRWRLAHRRQQAALPRAKVVMP